MKAFVFLAMLGILSTGVQAQDRVELNRERITVTTEEAILVRTAATPKKVKLKMAVPMYRSACLEYGTRDVIRTSGALCGYAVTERHVRDRVCVQRDRNNRCVRYENRVRVVRSSTPRTCRVSESYCANYGTASSRELDQVTITFKNAANLLAGEEETFVIRGRQNRHGGSGVKFEIEPVSVAGEYEIKDRGFLGFDSFLIKGK